MVTNLVCITSLTIASRLVSPTHLRKMPASAPGPHAKLRELAEDVAGDPVKPAREEAGLERLSIRSREPIEVRKREGGNEKLDVERLSHHDYLSKDSASACAEKVEPFFR
jgi:hypothetical protein